MRECLSLSSLWPIQAVSRQGKKIKILILVCWEAMEAMFPQGQEVHLSHSISGKQVVLSCCKDADWLLPKAQNSCQHPLPWSWIFLLFFNVRIQTTAQSIMHLINISKINYVEVVIKMQGFQCFINIDVGLLIGIVFSVLQLKYFSVGICQTGGWGQFKTVTCQWTLAIPLCTGQDTASNSEALVWSPLRPGKYFEETD